MTLEEVLQKLADLSVRRESLINDIEENLLHTEANKILYRRWMDTKNIVIRQGLSDLIARGRKHLEEFLYMFPDPDKPFDINDVMDVNLRTTIQEIEKVDTENDQLFKYILENFKSEEEIAKVKECIIGKRKKDETLDDTNNRIL